MKRAILITMLLLLVTASFAENTKPGGASIQFGYLVSDNDAAIQTAKAMGLETESTNQLHLDINGWSVLNRYMRLGGVLSGGWFDAKGEPDEDIFDSDESGVGFGNVSIALLPEIHMTFGPANISGGLSVGGGSIITSVNDWNGDNDGDMFFYGFTRPQVSAGYDLGPVGVRATIGYHLPFTGDKGEFWFIPEGGDSTEKQTYEFETTDLGGPFFEIGLFFGELGIRD
ncbi:MAG: hypothetical protein ACLFSQ_09305 [Candidatus Zixiibacteriota bacterium]